MKTLEEIYDRIIESQKVEFIEPNDCLNNIRNYKMHVPDVPEWSDDMKKVYSFISGCCKRHRSNQAPVTIQTLADLINKKKEFASACVHELIAEGWIIKTKNHSVGNHGNFYALTAKAKQTQHKWIVVSKYTRKPSREKIQKRIDKANEKQAKELTPIEAQIVKSMHEVKLDALKYSKIEAEGEFGCPESRNLFKLHANEIGSNQIRISTSEKVGRIFHTGNQCDRRLRKLFTRNGKQLIELDVVSMHPQLLTKYCTCYKERALLTELASKGFYSLFSFANGMSREDIKTAFNAYLNGATRHSRKPCYKDEGIYGLNWVRMIFEQTFPVLSESIEKDRVSKKIGRELQRLESSVFIVKLGQWAVNNDKFYVPVHDAVICDIEDCPEVIAIIMDGFKEIIGRDLQLSFDDKRGNKQIITRAKGKITISEHAASTHTITVNDIKDERTRKQIMDLLLVKHSIDPWHLNPFWVNQVEVQGIKAVADDGSIYVTDGFRVSA